MWVDRAGVGVGRVIRLALILMLEPPGKPGQSQVLLAKGVEPFPG